MLDLVREGLNNQEIAKRLGIGVETARALLRRIFRKLGGHPGDPDVA